MSTTPAVKSPNAKSFVRDVKTDNSRFLGRVRKASSWQVSTISAI